MLIELNLGKWGSIFPVPNSVVDEDIKLATENQLKVLLYVLRHNGDTLTEEILSDKLGINSDDVTDALNFWVSREVLSNTYDLPLRDNASVQKSKVQPARETVSRNATPRTNVPNPTVNQVQQNPIPINQGSVNQMPVNSTVQNVEPVKEVKKPRPLSRQQKPDSVFVAQRLKEDKQLAELLEEVQNVFGKPISSGDIATLVMLHETDGLPCEVLMMLVYYCHSIGKDNMRYIEKMGVEWAANDITTLERADERIANMQTYGESWKRVSQIIGMYNSGYPTKAQQENSNRWVNEWKFSDEMIKEAYERCVNHKNKFNISYTNGILKNWHKNGITTLQELRDFEEKKSVSNSTNKNQEKQAVSYDIDSYEDFSMFD